MIINRAAIEAITKNVIAIFNGTFKADGNDLYKKIAMEVTSNSKQNDYAWLGNIPNMREWVGSRVIQNLGAHTYSIVNKKFELTFAIGRDDIDDDSIGIHTPAVAMAGEQAAQHPNELVFDLLASGFSTTCYDGQNFFDTDHPVLNRQGFEQSKSNMQAGAGDAWFLLDTSRHVKPVIFQKRRDYSLKSMTDLENPKVFMDDEFIYGVDARVNAGFAFWQMAFGSKDTLNATNFKAARTAMSSLEGDYGKKLRIKPNILLVGATNQDAAEELIKKERNANGESNTLQNAVEIVVSPYL